MKKTTCLLLVLSLCLSLLAACGGETAPAATTAVHTPTSEATTATTEAATVATEPVISQAAKDALDGKKILFIGNSYTYWGNAVINKANNILDQESRSNDKGLFYQLCKENGIDVSVTNWVYGSHNFTDIMSSKCLCEESACEGANHMAHLKDAAFDYVCMQPFYETEYAGDIISHLTPAMDFFREANPDVKFLLLVPHMTFVRNFKWKGELQAAADAGITVVNWGGMLDDIVNKRVTVPGGTQQYFFATFVISRNANDGHHQNMLAGYLTVLMTYCAITGESAVGQPYAFVDDPSIHPNFDMEQFKEKNYTHEPFTNFIEVYRSEADMNGLQQLADQYIAQFNGGN